MRAGTEPSLAHSGGRIASARAGFGLISAGCLSVAIAARAETACCNTSRVIRQHNFFQHF